VSTPTPPTHAFARAQTQVFAGKFRGDANAKDACDAAAHRIARAATLFNLLPGVMQVFGVGCNDGWTLGLVMPAAAASLEDRWFSPLLQALPCLLLPDAMRPAPGLAAATGGAQAGGQKRYGPIVWRSVAPLSFAEMVPSLVEVLRAQVGMHEADLPIGDIKGAAAGGRASGMCHGARLMLQGRACTRCL
jgi:hypothetical protein